MPWPSPPAAGAESASPPGPVSSEAGASAPAAGSGLPPGQDPTAAPLDCSAITPAPASYELLEGFTSSEDFVFDELGNYVGVDDDNNLVRVSRDRQRVLWAPAIGATAGMGILPDGSVVFCEVEEGALKRVHPNGSVQVVLGGLLYPNGLDIGPDGFVYVAENSAGRVRRVNPDTGEFTIVAMGLHGPNGVAFSDDPRLLYVGSFEGSGIYSVEIPAPGELGHATVFARPPGARLRAPAPACPEQIDGAACFSPYFLRSTCQVLANVVDCLAVDPCPELEEGDLCDYPRPGACRAGRCDPFPTCRELGEGAACEFFGTTGTCQAVDGYLYCLPPSSCDGLAVGDTCEEPFGRGVCAETDGVTYCAVPNPCDGRQDGAACEDPFTGPGTCRSLEGFSYCEAPNPCEGLEAGARCEGFSFGPGVCELFEDYAYCSPLDPCEGRAAGAACEDQFVGRGVCQPFEAELHCGPPGPCAELSVGDPCPDPLGWPGVCQLGEEHAFCGPANPCEGQGAGAACEHVLLGAGTCRESEGSLACVPDSACEDLGEGQACEDSSGSAGTCQSGVCVGLAPSGGGIDGLGVDACGNVYASEYVFGNVWRISPDRKLELLAQLPSSWIPNIKWGRGLGGFSPDVMYVADRSQKRLFGMYVGVPGAAEFFDSER